MQKNAPIEQFWASSSLKDVANAEGAGVLAGESGTRVPMAQALEMFRALKSHNIADAPVCQSP